MGFEISRSSVLVVPRELLLLAVRVVLRDVPVVVGVRRNGEPDGGRHHPARLVGGHLGQDGEDHLPGPEELHALLPRHELAVGREDRADPHQVALLDAGVAQRHLEAGQLFLVAADATREEALRRHEMHGIEHFEASTRTEEKGGATLRRSAGIRGTGRRCPAGDDDG